MRVDLRRPYILVAEQFLDAANVLAPFKQSGRKRMTKRVGSGMFHQSAFRRANFMARPNVEA
jgi:hypothetical protein